MKQILLTMLAVLLLTSCDFISNTFNNEKDFGVLQVLFDDNSKKILNIKTLDVKAPIPSMTYYWLFGLLAICVPIFNIYVIKPAKQSVEKHQPQVEMPCHGLSFPSNLTSYCWISNLIIISQ